MKLFRPTEALHEALGNALSRYWSHIRSPCNILNTTPMSRLAISQLFFWLNRIGWSTEPTCFTQKKKPTSYPPEWLTKYNVVFSRRRLLYHKHQPRSPSRFSGKFHQTKKDANNEHRVMLNNQPRNFSTGVSGEKVKKGR